MKRIFWIVILAFGIFLVVIVAMDYINAGKIDEFVKDASLTDQSWDSLVDIPGIDVVREHNLSISLDQSGFMVVLDQDFSDTSKVKYKVDHWFDFFQKKVTYLEFSHCISSTISYGISYDTLRGITNHISSEIAELSYNSRNRLKVSSGENKVFDSVTFELVVPLDGLIRRKEQYYAFTEPTQKVRRYGDGYAWYELAEFEDNGILGNKDAIFNKLEKECQDSIKVKNRRWYSSSQAKDSLLVSTASKVSGIVERPIQLLIGQSIAAYDVALKSKLSIAGLDNVIFLPGEVTLRIHFDYANTRETTTMVFDGSDVTVSHTWDRGLTLPGLAMN